MIARTLTFLCIAYALSFSGCIGLKRERIKERNAEIASAELRQALRNFQEQEQQALRPVLKAP
jgi:hypothetical protein